MTHHDAARQMPAVADLAWIGLALAQPTVAPVVGRLERVTRVARVAVAVLTPAGATTVRMSLAQPAVAIVG